MNCIEEDPDVIFVDFDELFEGHLTNVSNSSENDEQDQNYDDEILFKLLQECSEDKKEGNPKKKRGPQPGRKAMTREQFYKIRPKMPRISKSDPRRSYASAFAEAYNSCDFDKIWEFVSEYCTKDILFIHRWVGQEQYVNFPKYLEIKGIESMAEYWYSRCVIVPDLVVDLKETKLYVRSDGISTVLSSFTIVCTRLYDGEVSDSIICKPAVDPELINNSIDTSDTNSSGNTSVESALVPDPATQSTQSLQYSEDSSQPDRICSKVMEKLSLILLNSTPPPRRPVGYKRKLSEDSEDLKDNNSINSESTDTNQNSSNAMSISLDDNKNEPVVRKIMPKFTSITLLGTVTLHLNQDHKIRQMELTFALKQ